MGYTTDALAESLWPHRDDWPTFRDLLAEMVAEQRAKALREAADAWQQGAWIDAPRHPDRVKERIAKAQYVTDWLRVLAADATTEAVGQ